MSPTGIPQIKPSSYPWLINQNESHGSSSRSAQGNAGTEGNQENNSNQTENKNLILVNRIIDGDTIELANGEKVRYIGINTPELDSHNSKIRQIAYQAKDKNTELVLGKMVELQKDISERDKYGRLLRYVYLEDGTFINLELVQQGFAYASAYPPDIAHQAEFEAAQQQAREQKIGLWQ